MIKTAPTENKMGSNQNFSIAINLIATFMLRISGNATAFMLGIYLATVVKAPPGLVGIVLTSSYFSELTLSPLMGGLSDRFGRKPFILVGPLVGALALQIYPLTALPVVLILGRLVEGTAGAIAGPTALSFLSDLTSGNEKRRGRIMTLFELATVIGSIAGQAAGGPIWDWLGKSGFQALTVIYLASAALVFFFLRESLPPGERQARSSSGLQVYLRWFRDRRVLAFVPAWLALNAVAASWLNFGPYLLKSDPARVQDYPGQLLISGYSASQASLILFIYSVIFAVGMGLWSLAYGRLSKTLIMLLNLGGMTLATLALFWINNLDSRDWRGTNPDSLPTTADQLHHINLPLPALLLILGLFGLGVLAESGFTPVAVTHLVDISRLYPGQKGSLLGLYSVLLGLGNLGGGWLGGPFVQFWGLNGVVYFTLLMLAISFASVFYVRRSGGDNIGREHSPSQ